MREKLNQIYVNHLNKPHTLEEIGMSPVPTWGYPLTIENREAAGARPLHACRGRAGDGADRRGPDNEKIARRGSCILVVLVCSHDNHTCIIHCRIDRALNNQKPKY